MISLFYICCHSFTIRITLTPLLLSPPPHHPHTSIPPITHPPDPYLLPITLTPPSSSYLHPSPSHSHTSTPIRVAPGKVAVVGGRQEDSVLLHGNHVLSVEAHDLVHLSMHPWYQIQSSVVYTLTHLSMHPWYQVQSSVVYTLTHLSMHPWYQVQSSMVYTLTHLSMHPWYQVQSSVVYTLTHLSMHPWYQVQSSVVYTLTYYSTCATHSYDSLRIGSLVGINWNKFLLNGGSLFLSRDRMLWCHLESCLYQM